jgi:hypothetical protein
VRLGRPPEFFASTPEPATKLKRAALPTPPPVCIPAPLGELSPWPAAMARGPHPFPSRTRSLSLAARMVLRGRPRGRVRRRRPMTPIAPVAHPAAGAFVHPAATSTSTSNFDFETSTSNLRLTRSREGREAERPLRPFASSREMLFRSSPIRKQPGAPERQPRRHLPP